MATISSLQWLSLVGAIWLQSISGTNFNLPAYSSQLKTVLSMSQVQLNNLAFASDAGKLFGWISGIAAAHLPLWLILLFGSFIGLIGYGVQFLFLTDQISSVSYWQVFLLSTLAGNSICWINTVCYTVVIKNFPSNREVAVGLSTSYQGLSAKIYTATVGALVINSPSSSFSSSSSSVSSSLPIKRAKAYLLLSSLLPVLICAVTAPFFRDIKKEKIVNSVGGKREGGFIVLFVITIGTGIFAVFTSLGATSRELLSPTPLGKAIGLGVFLFAPVVVPLATKLREILSRMKWKNREKRVHVIVEQDEMKEGHYCDEENTSIEIIGGLKEGENDTVTHDREGAEEIGVKEMLRRVEFWLYFFTYIFGATIGLVFLNNLGQIADSRGYSGTSSLVSLSSSFGFFGRLMPSLLDYFFSGKVCSRPASMATLMAPMCGAFFLLLHSGNEALYMSTAVIGVCTGAITSIAVSMTAELFGTKNFSINHNVVVANIPMGSFVFGFLAALSYRHHGHVGGDHDDQCIGMECYRQTFMVWGSLCSLGTILAWMLYARTRKF